MRERRITARSAPATRASKRSSVSNRRADLKPAMRSAASPSPVSIKHWNGGFFAQFLQQIEARSYPAT